MPGIPTSLESVKIRAKNRCLFPCLTYDRMFRWGLKLTEWFKPAVDLMPTISTDRNKRIVVLILGWSNDRSDHG